MSIDNDSDSALVAQLRTLSHLSIRQAADRVGRHPTTVLYHKQKHGLSFVGAQDARVRAQRTRADERRASYTALTHLPPSEVAKLLRVARPTVLQAALRYNLTFAPEPVLQQAAGVPAPARVQVTPRLPGPVAPVTRAARKITPPAPAPVPMPMAGAPDWTADRDAAVLQSKGRLADLSALAARWGLATARVTARWHILRASGPTSRRIET